MKSIIKPVTLALIFALTVSSCAAQYGSGWLSDKEQATHDGYGAWVSVTSPFSKSFNKQYEGELISVSKDSLYLINPFSHTFHALARQDITDLVGNTYDRGGYWQFGVGALIGSLVSVFTVGAFSIFTWPAYIISAIIGGSAASYISHIEYNGDFDDWRQLSTYARFPTGLPPTFNRDNPKTKSFHLDD